MKFTDWPTQSLYELQLWRLMHVQTFMRAAAAEFGPHRACVLRGLHVVNDEHGNPRPVYVVDFMQVELGVSITRTLLAWFEGDDLTFYEPSPQLVSLCQPLAEFVEGWLQGGEPVAMREPRKFDARHAVFGGVGRAEGGADQSDLTRDSESPAAQRGADIVVCHAPSEQSKDFALIGRQVSQSRVGRKGRLGRALCKLRTHAARSLLLLGVFLLPVAERE